MQTTDMKNRSARGAAKVSIVWTIGAVVAFLVAIVMFFLTSQVSTEHEVAAKKAEAEKKELETRLTNEVKQLQALSAVVGFYDEAQASRTEPDAVVAGLKTLREAFPDIDPSIKNIQKALPVVIQSYNAQKSRVKDMETQLAGLRQENETLNKNMRDLSDQNAKELASLRSQLRDAEQAKTDMQAELERQLAEARDSFKDRDAKWRQAQGTIDENQRKFAQEAQALRSRMNEQGRKLNPFVKEPEAADGRLLSVAKDLGLGWIDLGAKSRLAVGTRFRVVSGGAGEKRVKAWAEVTRVEADMAEVKLVDQTDPFDPPVTGDIVFNPLFDATGERHAVLIGRFSGSPSEKELRLLLSDMGVTVQKSLDKSTDFLIVGSEMYTDENNQPVEDPIQPTELPVYRDAIADGVQVVLLKDLRQYFRY